MFVGLIIVILIIVLWKNHGEISDLKFTISKLRVEMAGMKKRLDEFENPPRPESFEPKALTAPKEARNSAKKTQKVHKMVSKEKPAETTETTETTSSSGRKPAKSQKEKPADTES